LSGDKAEQGIYPKKTTRLQIAIRVSTNATIKRYFEFKTKQFWGLRMPNLGSKVIIYIDIIDKLIIS